MKSTKIIFNPTTNTFGRNNVAFKELSKDEQNRIINEMTTFINENAPLTDYDEDSIWMSYRYCIGRHTIASHMRANEIWRHAKNRMNENRMEFTAYDIDQSIQHSLSFGTPSFIFPMLSINKIVYGTGVDIVCEFLDEYDIKSIDDFIKYKTIHVIPTDNTRGYKFETVTWDEYLNTEITKICQKFYNDPNLTSECAADIFNAWKKNLDTPEALANEFKKIVYDMPSRDYYSMLNLEDLFVWSDLAHCFDRKNYHKSILIDGSEVEWFWSWKHKVELRDDGYYYQTFGYDRIRVPVDRWNGSATTYIPDESIKEDIY